MQCARPISRIADQPDAPALKPKMPLNARDMLIVGGVVARVRRSEHVPFDRDAAVRCAPSDEVWPSELARIAGGQARPQDEAIARTCSGRW